MRAEVVLWFGVFGFFCKQLSHQNIALGLGSLARFRGSMPDGHHQRAGAA